MRPVFCDQCDYELIGLPPKGKCPECGQRYDVNRHVGVRDQQTAEQRGVLIAKRIRTAIFILMSLGAAALGLYVQIAGKKDYALAVGIFVAVMFLMAAVMSYMSQKERD